VVTAVSWVVRSAHTQAVSSRGAINEEWDGAVHAVGDGLSAAGDAIGDGLSEAGDAIGDGLSDAGDALTFWD
jgi:hypothetical protein